MSRYNGHADGYGRPYTDEDALTSVEFADEWNWPCAAAAQTSIEVSGVLRATGSEALDLMGVTDPEMRPDGKDPGTYALGIAGLYLITVFALAGGALIALAP